MTAPAPFIHRFRVRYAEVDPQAIVFNSRYLEYADLMVSEFWRELGIGIGGDNPLEFHVARAQVDYHRPFRLDEMIEGRIHVARMGNSSMNLLIALHGLDDLPADGPRTQIELVQVHVDLASGKPVRVPDWLREKFARGLTGPEPDSAQEKANA